MALLGDHNYVIVGFVAYLDLEELNEVFSGLAFKILGFLVAKVFD